MCAVQMLICNNIYWTAAENPFAPHTSPCRSLCCHRLHPSFSRTDCPSPPAVSSGSSATHWGPIRTGRWRVEERERRWRVKWFCGRGGLSFTVIQALSGWRRGKVKWRGVPWHSSVSPSPRPRPIIDNSCAVWWLVSGRMGAGDETVT